MIAWLHQADSLLLGPFWFAGCVLLGGGALVAWLARIPSWRVRISELAFLGMAVWLVLALVPMPRLGEVAALGKESAAIAVVDLERSANVPGPSLSGPSANDLRAAGRSAAERDVAIERAAAAAAQPQQAKQVTAAESILPTMTEVWLFAAAICLAALLVGALLLWRLLSRSKPADASVQRLTQQVAQRLGLKGVVDVRIHDKLSAPFCCRLRTVVLPKELLADRNALRAVLAHELAHIVAAAGRRRTLLAMVTPLFILHPAWWVLRRMSTQASEEAADARAAMALGRVASHYARPLIELSARLGRNGVAPLHPSIVGVLGQPTSFTRRMTMLLTRDPAQAVRSLNRRQGILATASTLLALALSVGAWGTPASAQGRGQGAAAAPMEQTIRPDFTDCALRDALLIISRKSGLRIAIDTGVAARNIRIKRLALGEMPVRRLLDTLAVAHDLRWKMEKGRVVFRPAKAKVVPIEAPPLLREYLRGVQMPPEAPGKLLVDPDLNRDESQQSPAVMFSDRYLKQAQAMLEQGEVMVALEQCDRALQLQPDSAKALRLRAKLLRAMGDEAGAKSSLEHALRLDPHKAGERPPQEIFKIDPNSNKDKSLRTRFIDAQGRVYNGEVSASVEAVLPDALRKASKRQREAAAVEARRKALQKALPDMPAQYRKMLLEYYRTMKIEVPQAGVAPLGPEQQTEGLPTLEDPIKQGKGAGTPSALRKHYDQVMKSVKHGYYNSNGDFEWPSESAASKQVPAGESGWIKALKNGGR